MDVADCHPRLINQLLGLISTYGPEDVRDGLESILSQYTKLYDYPEGKHREFKEELR